jgi:bacterioferritin-associated ferredoxin
MIICICHRVSDRDIARDAAAGCSFDEVQFERGVGTRCGACLDSARGVHGQHACPPGHAMVRCLGARPETAVSAAAA